jgi:hypothetical protein
MQNAAHCPGESDGIASHEGARRYSGQDEEVLVDD